MTAPKGWTYLSEWVHFIEVQQVCNYILYTSPSNGTLFPLMRARLTLLPQHNRSLQCQGNCAVQAVIYRKLQSRTSPISATYYHLPWDRTPFQTTSSCHENCIISSFFFYQVVTKILNKDSKKSPKATYFVGYGTWCRSTTITLCHTLSQITTLAPSPSIHLGNSPGVFTQNLLIFLMLPK